MVIQFRYTERTREAMRTDKKKRKISIKKVDGFEIKVLFFFGALIFIPEKLQHISFIEHSSTIALWNSYINRN